MSKSRKVFVPGGIAKTEQANTFSQKQTFGGEVEIDGALNHDGTTVGFYGVAPVTRPTAYTQTYATAARNHAQTAANEAHSLSVVYSDTEHEAAFNALAVRINELKQLVNSIIDDHQARGDFQ